MTDLASVLGDAALVESPRVVEALEDFIVEAIEEATDLLRFGDMATRTQLIRLILSMALKSKDTNSTQDAEKILAKTREAISGIV